jgi:cupin 2 domain-containing protein
MNLLDDIPAHADREIFTDVLLRERVRIERIVSTGQSTPADQPHRQRHERMGASPRGFGWPSR